MIFKMMEIGLIGLVFRTLVSDNKKALIKISALYSNAIALRDLSLLCVRSVERVIEFFLVGYGGLEPLGWVPKRLNHRL